MAGITLTPFPLSAEQNGFTLVEVLAALGLLAIGVLGSSALQQEALRQSFAALSESRARFLLQDLAERMHASGDGSAYLLTYAAATPAVTTDCARQMCEGDALARWELAEWRARVEDTAYLPAGKGQVSADAARGLYTVAIRYGAAPRELALSFEP